MIRGMRTNSEYVQKYSVLVPTMLNSRLHELIKEFSYGQIATICRAELRRRDDMDGVDCAACEDEGGTMFGPCFDCHATGYDQSCVAN